MAGRAPPQPPVVVLGGGSAGSAAARALARAGQAVLLLERGALDQAGARWVNGVPAWCFDEGGVERPQAPERRGPEGPFHLIAGWDGPRVIVPEREVYAVDMRRLITRLQTEAAAAGAELRGGVEVRGWLGDDLLDTSRGPVRARWVVDASGGGGSDLAWSPPIRREHWVTAAQEVREVRDPAGASAWAASVGVAQGEVACFTGVAGGYSVVHLRWTGPEIELLTGSLPPAPSAKQLLRDQLAQKPWIGDRIFGGARAIPLRPPHLRLAEGRLARLGDAACQVYGAHGSGVGSQLVAAQVLARAFAEGRGPAGYAADWQRRWGGRHAASALFAHYARALSPEALGRLIQSGLLGPWSVRPTLEQRSVGLPPLRQVPRLVRGLTRQAPTLAPLAPVLARMALAPWVWSHHRPNQLWELLARHLLPP